MAELCIKMPSSINRAEKKLKEQAVQCTIQRRKRLPFSPFSLARTSIHKYETEPQIPFILRTFSSFLFIYSFIY